MKVKVARYKVLSLKPVKKCLHDLLMDAGFEEFAGPIAWRFSDRGNDDSRVCVVAYKTGSVVVSGHGPKFDLTSGIVKTYDVGVKSVPRTR